MWGGGEGRMAKNPYIQTLPDDFLLHEPNVSLWH